MRSAVLPLAVLGFVLSACRDQTPQREWSPGADAGPTAPSPAPSGIIGSVEAVLGAPTLLRDTQPVTATAGAAVHAGDRITTGPDAKARVRLQDQSILAIGPRSSVTLSEMSTHQERRRGKIHVIAGQFWMQVAKWAGAAESVVEITTPNAVAGVRGTTLWGDTERDVICALEGQIEVRNTSNGETPAVQLSAGNCASELSKGKLTGLQPDAKTVQSYLDEVTIR